MIVEECCIESVIELHPQGKNGRRTTRAVAITFREIVCCPGGLARRDLTVGRRVEEVKRVRWSVVLFRAEVPAAIPWRVRVCAQDDLLRLSLKGHPSRVVECEAVFCTRVG